MARPNVTPSRTAALFGALVLVFALMPSAGAANEVVAGGTAPAGVWSGVIAGEEEGDYGILVIGDDDAIPQPMVYLERHTNACNGDTGLFIGLATVPANGMLQWAGDMRCATTGNIAVSQATGNPVIEVTLQFTQDAAGDRWQIVGTGDPDNWMDRRCDEDDPADGTIVGTAGDDVLVGTGFADIIDGRGGNDEIQGKGGMDLLCGGDGDDVIRAGGGLPVDVVLGGDGDDRLFGVGGTDVIFGGDGADKVFAGGHFDAVWGEAGRDKLDGQLHNDTIDGGSDTDWLWGRSGDDELYGGPNSDFLYGGVGNDTMRGQLGNDRMFGEAGDDSMWGDEGRDQLRGQGGDDTLDGGADKDWCSVETNVTNCEVML